MMGKIIDKSAIITNDIIKEKMKNHEILVSICCLTYNHESYIRQCLDGFIMQKTNFPFEVLIHDDASTDRTAQIIREYEEKYPNIIKPIYQTENQYSKRISPTTQFLFPNVKGKYIALCEGDDYWIDPLKLQKQVNFFKENKNAVYVFTARQIKNEKDNTKTNIQQYKERIYTTKDFLSGFNPGIQSVLFRTSKLCLEEYRKFSLFINGDRLLPYMLSLKGEIRYLPNVTAVYRVTGKGISTSISKKEWFQHASYDFYRFHKFLGFPDMKCYAKGQAKYVFGVLKTHFFHPLRFFRTTYYTLTSYETIKPKKVYLSILYQTGCLLLKKSCSKINLFFNSVNNYIF